MDPITTSALIAGGSALIGQGANAFSQGSMNRKTREWNEKMYDRQQQDALANWERQNSYNSPEQQMARLTKAGLNPNLVYGNGTVANNASAPDTPHAMPYKPEAPNFNLPQIFDSFFNVQSQAQRLSNERQIGNNLALDALIKTEDARSKGMLNSYMEKYGYGFKKYSESSSADLVYQKLLAQNALNAYNFGSSGDFSAPISKGSAYDLQSQGLSLLNRLRGLEADSKKELTGISKIKRQYTERMMSGRFSDLSAKDIMMMLIQGGHLLNSTR